jgi:hypothetical protein
MSKVMDAAGKKAERMQRRRLHEVLGPDFETA